MSTDAPGAAPAEEVADAPQSADVHLTYAGASQLVATEGEAKLMLFGNLDRDPVRLDGTIKEPLRFREAMAALYAVVGSDFRYVPKDRTAYLAYTRMKREVAGLSLWQSQQAYFSWLMRNDPLAFVVLDPVVTVHPDQVLFEVFSKDEGTYASLGVDRSAFALDGTPTCGTTNIDFSQALYGGIQQMRSYRETRLAIGKEAVQLTTPAPGGEVLEKKVHVPDTWLRGFLQVQTAATLPHDSFRLAPIDVYNLFRTLRMQGDRKGQRRGLRVELVPGEAPRLVLEPWETVLTGSAGTFKGKASRVVRVWGRRRLMLIRRILPYVEHVEGHVLGSGLPSFWVFRAGPMTLTIGITGFTAANWSQAVSFDLLLPRKAPPDKALSNVLTALSKTWFAPAKDLVAATGLKGAALLEALQHGCQQGKIMYDLAAEVYRLRPLTDKPLDLIRLEYRNRRERIAHDLVARRGAVKIVTENRIAGSGVELTGKVSVTEDKREYRPQMLLGDEGQVGRPDCTCPPLRKQGIKAGPCPHLIALRLAFAAEEAKRQTGGDPRETVTVETRTYSKRSPSGEDVVQVTLDRQRLKVRRGQNGQPMRLQTLRFNSVDDARSAYFARVDELTARGYLDATAG
jgi:hypothetical protein